MSVCSVMTTVFRCTRCKKDAPPVKRQANPGERDTPCPHCGVEGLGVELDFELREVSDLRLSLGVGRALDRVVQEIVSRRTGSVVSPGCYSSLVPVAKSLAETMFGKEFVPAFGGMSALEICRTIIEADAECRSLLAHKIADLKQRESIFDRLATRIKN